MMAITAQIIRPVPESPSWYLKSVLARRNNVLYNISIRKIVWDYNIKRLNRFSKVRVCN